MARGYIYMFLGLLSFSLLGIFHKIAEVKRCRPGAINVLLFFWSLVFITGFVLLVKHGSPVGPAEVLLVAAPFGMCAGIAILAFQSGIRHGNIATSWLAINLSAGIPTMLSILLYGEPVNARKGIALVLIVVSMFLLWKDKRQEEERS